MDPSAIVKCHQQKVFQKGDLYCQYSSTLADHFSPQFFIPDYWQQQNAIIGNSQGRGLTYFVKYQQQEWVLRHYYRGGMIGKILNDSYLFTGWHRTRAHQEFSLLQQLEVWKLPAPKVIAYKVVRKGFYYQADLLTERIKDAQDVVAILSERPLDNTVWLNIGKTIRTFHKHGVYHHDLNAHNILLDHNNKVWIIDFDRGQLRQPKNGWQQTNLSRLQRSLLKETNKIKKFHYQQENWQHLLEGYLSK